MSSAERLRALYVADTTANVRMLEGLARSFDITLLARASLGPRVATRWPPEPGARIDRVLLRGGRVGFALRAAWWIVRRRRRFDVVIALDSLLAALAANVARLVGGPPVVLQVGRPTLEYIRVQRRLRPAWRHLPRLSIARLLVAVNERLAAAIGTVSDYVARECARRNNNVRAIAWYGIDTGIFAPRWTRAEARALLMLPQDAPIVLYRSRLAPEKDPETFLRAVDRLRRDGRTIHAVYMGGEWAQMCDIARRLGVEVLARDCSSTDEIPVWYVAADVTVQTSWAEGLGLSPLESLACGTPVVCTDVGGLPEVVDGGRLGELVPLGDASATAAAVARLVDDPQNAAATTKEARAWIGELYSADGALAAWTELIAGAARCRRWRVLFVDQESRLSGGQRDLVDLVRALDPDRVEVHAALPEEGELAEALRGHGAAVHIVRMAGNLLRVSRWDLARRPDRAVRYAASAAAAMLRLARLARRLRPDVVHSNSLKAHLLASPAAKLARARNVWHVRDILDGWLREAWRLLAGILADRVVCLSEVASEPFRRGRAAPKVRVVYNGIRPRPVSDGDVTAWRRSVGADDGEPVVGIVGQLARWKGQDTFVEAAALLARERPELRFAIVGSCLFPDNESAYVASLRARADELGLNGRLSWVGYADPIEPVMAAFDVCVHASRLPEPFGRVIVEAMAQGTPVVASALGAGPELVPPEAGRFVAPDDPPALAAAIEDLLADTHGRDRAAGAARQAAAGFDISRTGAGVLAVYEELLT